MNFPIFCITFVILFFSGCNRQKDRDEAISRAVSRHVELFHINDGVQVKNDELIDLIRNANSLRQLNLESLIKYAGDPVVDSLISFLREEIRFQDEQIRIRQQMIDMKQIRCPQAGRNPSYWKDPSCSEFRRAKYSISRQIEESNKSLKSLVKMQYSLSHLGIPRQYLINTN